MRRLISLIICILFAVEISAQYTDYTPVSPEANSLMNSVNAPVGKYTGTFSYSLPVHAIKEGNLTLPISIDYRGASKQNTEIASPAGLGWTISTGGFITRKVNGLPDEHVNGFLATRVTFPYNTIENWITNDDKDAIEQNFLEGCWDTKPDEFYFSVGGVSGKFTFSWDTTEDIIVSCDKPIKINSYQRATSEIYEDYDDVIINNPIISWIITDHTGVKYEFNQYETTGSIELGATSPKCANGGVPGDIIHYGNVSSWYLTKIEDAYNSNDFITLNYTDNGYKTDIFFVEQHTIIDLSEPYECLVNYLSALGTSPWKNLIYDDPMSYTVIKSKSISSITNASGNTDIQFVYNTNRNDIDAISATHSPPKRLDEINININGNLAKKYTLDYFNDTNQKLLLKDYTNVPNDMTTPTPPPYRFEYHAPDTDADNPFSVDHWGYANGSTTATNLPRMIFNNPAFANGQFVFEGSDKSANLGGSKSYVLNKITFPSGGYKIFEVELNSASKIQTVSLEEANNVTSLYNLETETIIGQYNIPSVSDGGTITNYSLPFEVVDDGDPNNNCEGNGTIVRINFSGNLCDELGIELIHPDGTAEVLATEVTMGNCIDISFDYTICLPPGSYSLRFQSVYPDPTEYQYINTTISYDKLDVPNNGEYVNIGGVRVSKILTYDNDNALINVLNYDYTDDSGKTTGVIYGVPKYYDEYVRLVWTDDLAYQGAGFTVGLATLNTELCEELIIGTSSKSLFAKTQGSHIGYESVKEFNSGTNTAADYLTNVNGYTKTTFTSPAQYSDIIEYNRPYTHPYSSSHMTGLPTLIEHYNNSNQLVSSTVNDYEEINIEAPVITLSYGYVSKAGPLSSMWYTGDETFGPGITTQLLWNGVNFDNAIAYSYRPYNYGYPNLISSSTTTYDEAGQNSLTDIMEYEYDNTYNNLTLQRTWRETTINGIHDVSEDYTTTEYKYIYDGAGAYNGIATLQSDIWTTRNIVGIPFETAQYINGTLMGGNLIELAKTGNILYPKKYEVVAGGNWIDQALVTSVNASGQPKQIKKYRLNGVLDDNYTTLTWSNDLVTSVANTSDLGTQTNNYSYTTNRQLDQITDHNGQITKYDYDGLLRLSQISTGKAVGEASFRQNTNIDYRYKFDDTGTAVNPYNEVVTTVNYTDNSFLSQVNRVMYDGLGRELRTQKDDYDATDPTGDVTTNRKVYDSFGRISEEENLGTGITTFEYEDAPTNRLLNTITPIGTINQSYGANSSAITIGTKTYPIGSLSEVTINDVNGNTTIGYTDFLGRNIQEKKEVTLSTGLTDVITSSVYNDLNQLTEVIPPAGASYLYTYNNRGLLITKQIPNQNGIHTYWYDQLGRLVASKDPNLNLLGTEYDDLNREITNGELNPISSDTENFVTATPTFKQVHNTTAYKTDVIGDPIDWIDFTSTTNLENPAEVFTTTYTQYDPVGRPKIIDQQNHKGGTEKTTNIYNDANLITQSSLQHNLNNASFGQQLNFTWDYTYDHSLRPLDVIYANAPGTASGQLISHLEYNDKDQVIKKSLHEKVGGGYWQIINYTYDDAGRLLKINDPATVKQSGCNITTEICADEFRLAPDVEDGVPSLTIEAIHITNEMGEDTTIVLEGIEFPLTLTPDNVDILKNGIGKWIRQNDLIYDDVYISKDLSMIRIEQTNAPINKITVSGQAVEATSLDCCDPDSDGHLFAEELIYPTTGSNIDEMIWTSPCGGVHKYTFQYDELNRLLDADYFDAPTYPSGGSWNPSTTYDVNISYDVLGNILTLNRMGWVNNAATAIDQLTYAYTDATHTSRLMSVTDGTGSNFTAHGQKGNTSFSYDNNGNMLTDVGKDLTIDYNYQNLPKKVYKTSLQTDEIINTYLANMTKVQKHTEENGITTTKDYIGSIEYITDASGTRIEAIYHDEGRFIYDASGTLQYEYTLKDHLGNARISFSDRDENGNISKGDILQENHYYPFGMNMEGDWIPTIGTLNDYQYNGKELVEDLGLGWNDYGARYYDAALGRWNAIDPISVNYSSLSGYNYVANNPLLNIDPDGRFILRGDRKQKRSLRKMIKAMRKEAKSWTKEQWSTVSDITGMTKRQFMRMFRAGRGPVLEFAPKSKDVKINGYDEDLMYGEGDGSTLTGAYALTGKGAFQDNPVITIDRKIHQIIVDLEKSKKTNNPYGSFDSGGLLSPSDYEAFLESEERFVNRFLIGVLGHELGHAGAKIMGKPDFHRGLTNDKENGNRMEKLMGGRVGFYSPEVGYGVYSRYIHYQYRNGGEGSNGKTLEETRNSLQAGKFQSIYPQYQK